MINATDTPVQAAHHVYASPYLYIADWLSHDKHAENKDYEIAGMNMNVNAITASLYILGSSSVEDIQAKTHEDTLLQKQKGIYIIQGWLHKGIEVDHSMK